jgi:hypothetical protein
MIPLNITFVGKDDPPPWKGDFIDCGILEDVNILEGGMTSGLPSLAFRVKLPVGKGVNLYAVMQQTSRQIVSLARIIMGRYPDLMYEDPVDMKTKDVAGMLQDLLRRDLEVFVLTREQMERLLQQIAIDKPEQPK